MRSRREIRRIRNERGHVRDTRTDTAYHGPCEVGSVEFTGLVDDGAYAFGFDDGPDEECDACNGDEYGFGGEEVADFVDWEPDCGEGDEPE